MTHSGTVIVQPGRVSDSEPRGWHKLGEQIKDAWFKFIPPWLPILIALLWIGMQYQKIIDRQDSLEKQVQAIQEYMRTQHAEKSGFQGQKRDYYDDKALPQTADDPSLR